VVCAAAADVDLGTSFKPINVLIQHWHKMQRLKNYVDTALNLAMILATQTYSGQYQRSDNETLTPSSR
jgi:hypothetical protein